MTIPIDENGYIPVRNRLLSKVGVYPYLGSSIGANEPNKIYMVYRPADELSNEETINSFKLVPLIDDHEMLGTDATPAEKKGVQGTTGEEIYFKDDGLYGNLKVFSESLKNLIDGGKKELSLGYKCKYVFETGIFEGQKYDAIQTNLRGNHIALVDEGRMGKEVSVVDEALKTVVTMDRQDIKIVGDNTMTEEQIKYLLDAINGMSAKLDSLIKAEETAKDSDVKSEDAEEETKVEDAEVKNIKKENETLVKKVEDMEEKAKGIDEAIKKSVMKELTQRDKLVSRLTPLIGSFDHLEMDLNSVVCYGIKKLNLESDKGLEMATLNGYLAGTTVSKSSGMDSKTETKNVSFDMFK